MIFYFLQILYFSWVSERGIGVTLKTQVNIKYHNNFLNRTCTPANIFEYIHICTAPISQRIILNSGITSSHQHLTACGYCLLLSLRYKTDSTGSSSQRQEMKNTNKSFDMSINLWMRTKYERLIPVVKYIDFFHKVLTNHIPNQKIL